MPRGIEFASLWVVHTGQGSEALGVLQNSVLGSRWMTWCSKRHALVGSSSALAQKNAGSRVGGARCLGSLTHHP